MMMDSERQNKKLKIMGSTVKNNDGAPSNLNDPTAERDASSIPHLPWEVIYNILPYFEPFDDRERWAWVETMATVSETFLEAIQQRYAPTVLRVHVRCSDSIKLSKEGELSLKVSNDSIGHGRLNVEALKALIEVPNMLSKVQQVGIIASGFRFDLGLSRDLPLVKHIKFYNHGDSRCYIEPPSPLQLQHESSLHHLGLESMNSLSAETLNVLFQTIGSNLKTLKLSDCYSDTSGQRKISDAEIKVIGHHCHQLESFSVTNSELITAIGISSILQTNPRLIELDIQTCPRVDGGKLVRDLARDCHQLQTLSLRDVKNLTPENLNILLQTIGTYLKALNLYGCSAGRSNDVSGWRDISDTELGVIGRHCFELESFSVADSKRVTANGIVSILRSNRLIELNVTRFNSIDGFEFARVLARDGRQLQTLDLRYDELVANSVLNGIRQGLLPELHTITLYFNSYFSTRNVTIDCLRRALENSSTLGRGFGKVLVHSSSGEHEGQKAEWKQLVHDFHDVKFVFEGLMFEGLVF